MLNLTNKTAYHVFDEFGMLVVKGDERSWRDSIGRTVLAWIAYGKPKELDDALYLCYGWNKKRHILWRHPKHIEEASRDHYSYWIIYNKLWNNEFVFNQIIKDTPSMRGLNSWMKALTGNKRAEWWYYTLAISSARIGNGFLRACRWVGRIKKERLNENWVNEWIDNKITVGWYIQRSRTPWQKLWAWIIFTSMPAYALHNKAWQIYVLPKSPKRDTLRKILLKRVGKSNIMLRLLFGDVKREYFVDPDMNQYFELLLHEKTKDVSKMKLQAEIIESMCGVTQEEIDSYPHMTGYRPGVYLDETCRRDIRELTDEEAEANAYEKDLIIWLWNGH